MGYNQAEFREILKFFIFEAKLTFSKINYKYDELG